jgi:hypothetical protein
MKAFLLCVQPAFELKAKRALLITEHRDFDTFGARRRFRFRIARINVARHAQAGVVREHAV